MPSPSSIVVAAPGANGDIEAIRQLAREVDKIGASAIALFGNLTPRRAPAREYAEVLKTLSEPRLLVFQVPGPRNVSRISLRRITQVSTVLKYSPVRPDPAQAPARVHAGLLARRAVPSPEALRAQAVFGNSFPRLAA
jgi:hypothetical protein